MSVYSRCGSPSLGIRPYCSCNEKRRLFWMGVLPSFSPGSAAHLLWPEDPPSAPGKNATSQGRNVSARFGPHHPGRTLANPGHLASHICSLK